MKHTPGPWKVKYDSTEPAQELYGYWVDVGPALLYAGNDWCDNSDTLPETLANANLIAAAPELLEVCELVLYWGNQSEEYLPRLKEVIARAKGLQ